MAASPVGLVRLAGAGGDGRPPQRPVLILHATGLLCRMYAPLAVALAAAGHDVWGLDFPGHGAAAGLAPPLASPAEQQRRVAPPPPRGVPALSLEQLAAYVADAVRSAGLAGCFALGHSGGGTFALLAAAQAPGLFAGVCCFEAVAATPATHGFMASASAAGAITTSGSLLVSLAMRRQAVFASRQQASRRLAAKPPFAGMARAAVDAYLQHGLRPAAAPGGSAQQPQAQQAEPPDAQQQKQTQQQAQQQQAQQQAGQLRLRQQHAEPPPDGQPQPVELVCPPLVEASYYAALNPPPSVPLSGVGCPVLLAIAAPGGGGGGAAASAWARHDAVEAWLLANQQSRAGGAAAEQLHGVLAVVNAELAAALPRARLAELRGVSHFGPLEAPQALADTAAAFFQACQQGGGCGGGCAAKL